MNSDAILPDLQSCVLCEDVRCEFNGMQTLVGVVNVIPAPQLPINCMRLCIGRVGVADRGISGNARASWA